MEIESNEVSKKERFTGVEPEDGSKAKSDGRTGGRADGRTSRRAEERKSEAAAEQTGGRVDERVFPFATVHWVVAR